MKHIHSFLWQRFYRHTFILRFAHIFEWPNKKKSMPLSALPLTSKFADVDKRFRNRQLFVLSINIRPGSDLPN